MNLVIIGASGLAREVYDLAMTCYGDNPNFTIKGFLSDGPSNIEEMGYPKVLNTVQGYSIEKDDVFFCAIGKCSSCFMVVDGVPNVRTCVTPLAAGMKVETQLGKGLVPLETK